jgi:hypothetical protein
VERGELDGCGTQLRSLVIYVTRVTGMPYRMPVTFVSHSYHDADWQHFSIPLWYNTHK